ncbi:hypothetical protein FOA52_009625 [Chlamydomonas sp. UWO 241]|nr:hypothetical protein FOA52_009625 [Chlamydomonas sp. UWO 241]
MLGVFKKHHMRIPLMLPHPALPAQRVWCGFGQRSGEDNTAPAPKSQPSPATPPSTPLDLSFAATQRGPVARQTSVGTPDLSPARPPDLSPASPPPESSPSALDLAREILLRIFSTLHAHDVGVCAAVTSSWRDVIKQEARAWTLALPELDPNFSLGEEEVWKLFDAAGNSWLRAACALTDSTGQCGMCSAFRPTKALCRCTPRTSSEVARLTSDFAPRCSADCCDSERCVPLFDSITNRWILSPADAGAEAAVGDPEDIWDADWLQYPDPDRQDAAITTIHVHGKLNYPDGIGRVLLGADRNLRILGHGNAVIACPIIVQQGLVILENVRVEFDDHVDTGGYKIFYDGVEDSSSDSEDDYRFTEDEVEQDGARPCCAIHIRQGASLIAHRVKAHSSQGTAVILEDGAWAYMQECTFSAFSDTKTVADRNRWRQPENRQLFVPWRMASGRRVGLCAGPNDRTHSRQHGLGVLAKSDSFLSMYDCTAVDAVAGVFAGTGADVRLGQHNTLKAMTDTRLAAALNKKYTGHKYTEFLAVALSAAIAAGDVIAAAFKEPKDVVHKGAVDLVTATDQACENIVQSRLKEAFPSHRFIGEEGSAAQGFTAELTDEPTWMCDPLDGTTNFVHSFPFVCVCIGLVINKRVVVGVVHNPILNETFTATRGGGARLNDARISASATSQLGNALVCTEIGTTRDEETVDAIFARMRAVATSVRSMRCCGSCACNLTSVACGRLDGFYEIGFGGCWDVAAASLILEEAGGVVLDPAGGPFDVMARRVLGTNAHLARPLAEILAGCPVSKAEPGASLGDK